MIERAARHSGLLTEATYQDRIDCYKLLLAGSGEFVCIIMVDVGSQDFHYIVIHSYIRRP